MYWITDHISTEKTDDVNMIADCIRRFCKNETLIERIQREAREQLENCSFGVYVDNCFKIMVKKTIDDPFVLLEEVENIRLGFEQGKYSYYYDCDRKIRAIQSMIAEYAGMSGNRAEWYDEMINRGKQRDNRKEI